MRQKGLHTDDDGPDAQWDYIDVNFYEFRDFTRKRFEQGL
jgi:hypothetical protein